MKNQNNNYPFIDNKTIKYSFVIMACDTCAPISNLGYRVMVELTDKEKGEAKKIHCKEWESLLNDVRRDWAANLILYYLYKKDAHLLARRNSRILWAKFFRKEDLEFWEKTLCGR